MMGLRGTGDALTPLWFMIVAVVLDSGLNPVFILGLGPAPALGIAGSATATVIANYVALIGLLIYIYRARPADPAARPRAALSDAPIRAILKTIVVKGLPMGLQMIVISVARRWRRWAWSTARASTPPPPSASRMQLWTYIQMPAMALGAAVSAMAAQNIGAGKWDRVGAITRSGIIYNLLITGAARRRCSPSPTGRRWPCSSAATARRCRSPSISSCSRPGASSCSASRWSCSARSAPTAR